jgi:prephenate dehydratase
MTCWTLGPEGTFSHEIAMRICGAGVHLRPTIREVFRAVVEEGGSGVLPIENSEAGGVGETLDGLRRFPVFITGEAYMAIRHSFAVRNPGEPLRVIYAHPQSHEQCSGFLDELGVPVIHTSSNAASAGEAARRPGAAAITSIAAAALAGLVVRRENVQNDPGNTTRFVRIAAAPEPCDAPEKCSIIVDPSSDRPGLLHAILGVFARRSINLTRIESRPSRRGIGTYIFYIDFMPAGDRRPVIEELENIAGIRDLGAYRRLEVAP